MDKNKLKITKNKKKFQKEKNSKVRIEIPKYKTPKISSRDCLEKSDT